MSNLNKFVDPNLPVLTSDQIFEIIETAVDKRCFICGKVFKGLPTMVDYCKDCLKEAPFPFNDPPPVKRLTVISNVNLDRLVKDINECNIKKEDIVNTLYSKCTYKAFVCV